MNQDNKKKYNGLLTILLSQASDMPKRSNKDIPEMYFVKATYGAQTFYTAAVDGQIPVYGRSFRVPLIEAEKHPVTLSLFKGINASDKGKDNELIGTLSLPYESIVNATAYTLSSCRQVCEKGPSLEYSISVCGLVQAKKGIEAGSAATLIDHAASSPDKGTPVDVTIEKGWGFKAETRGLRQSDIPDTYIKLTFGSSPRVWRTKTIKNNFTPFWQETQHFEMRDHSQIISIEAWDEDSGSSDTDDLLGSARVSVGKILLAGGSFDVELLQDGKPSGIYVTIRCEISAGVAGPDTASKSETASSVPPAVVSPESIKTGTTMWSSPSTHLNLYTEKVDAPTVKPSEVRFCLTAVKGSGFQVETRRFGKKDIPDVYCAITIGEDIKWRTKTIKNDLAPMWNESKSFCLDNGEAVIHIKVYDEDDGIADTDDFLGMASLPVGTLLSCGTKDLDLLNKDGTSTGCILTFKCSAE
jgi:C2 domain